MTTPVEKYASLAKISLEDVKMMLTPLPGEEWEYPKWYFEFLRGELPLATTPQPEVKKLLMILSDSGDKWHSICKSSGIDKGTIRACEELGLVKWNFEILQGSDCWLGVFRISEVGKAVIEKNTFIV